MGAGLQRARAAAKATRHKPKSPSVIMVTNSTGCVYCDLGLNSESLNHDPPAHYVDRIDRYVPCTKHA